MMARILNASELVRHGYDNMQLKMDASPVTDVDLASSAILTAPSNYHMVSEETWQPGQADHEYVTWVDPLDATKEYTEGLTQYVTIMACLTHHGTPIAGIIHFPFRNETWAALNGTWVSRPYELIMPTISSTIVSRSHAGSIAKLYPMLNMVAAGGSGYKSVEVLKGHHTAYMHATKIKAWDICAPDALIHTAGGTFINLMGHRYNYTTHVFKDGLYASIVYSWSMFRMYMFITSKWFKLVLITIVYASLYMFIRRKVQTSTLPQTVDGDHAKLAFWKCVIGLVGSYLVWGVAQERLMSHPYGVERFSYASVAIWISRVGAFLVARRYKQTSGIPFKLFSLASLSNVFSTTFQYEALLHVIFPVVVVFKSLKTIPVMLMGVLLFGKRYGFKDVCVALVIACGVALTTFRRGEGSTSTFGIGLMCGYIFFDAFTSQWQGFLLKRYNGSSLEMMYGVNAWSSATLGIVLLCTGELIRAVQFVFRHPEVLIHALGLCVPSVVGQWFIFKTIESHGPVVFTMIMIARQAFSIGLSCLLFGHILDVYKMIGISVVIGTLCVKSL